MTNSLMATILVTASVFLGWLLGKPKKNYPSQIEPDEPWPRIEELDPEAGVKWEADQKRREEIKYGGMRRKNTKNR